MGGSINYLAVLAAAIAAFVIGGLWYAPFSFERPWRKAAGLSDADMQRGSAPMIFGVAFVCTLVAAYALAWVLGGPETTAMSGLTAGLIIGFGIAAMSLGVMASFERRPPVYLLINGGYLTVLFAVMGLILGAWR